MSVGGENVTFRIEVEERPLSVLLVFDRKTDVALVPWQDAHRLADVMDQVIKDVSGDFMTAYPVIDPAKATREQAQVRLTHHEGLVAILVNWTDRIQFTSLQAFSLVARALRQAAQDAHLEQDKGIHLTYGKGGLVLKTIHNDRTGLTQIVR